ncbi:MAG: V-type ATP synthase subunit A, partial [Spirochaetales bacterium]|nr:V-type ATP synthase subunit A [Spirochaetales bacterium]
DRLMIFTPWSYVYGSAIPLSLELGPGIIGTIYDGIQRPLEKLFAISGNYIERGLRVPPLDREKQWHFIPRIRESDFVSEGEIIGTVQETEGVEHRILVPPGKKGKVSFVAGEIDCTLETCVAELADGPDTHKLTLFHKWPIRIPRPSAERLPLEIPLVTGQRVIDTLFPIPKGGTVAIPGGFGTGKTMTQHAVAKWCDADIIVYIGCGERGNEMTDVLTDFPELIDPRTGRSLMERTILIANTSNMPVSAREASVYTGVTLAEYYRDQGYDVAVMADSTSRWAEALRELSGRMEEMPAEEGFPAYLPTRIAGFYERAGAMTTLGGSRGSVSIIGAVSPPGGDFSEPVTQHTKRFVRCFWALDRQLANARHYPAISWIDSYSEYLDEIAGWWEEKTGGEWSSGRREIMDLLQKEVRLQQVVKLVGPDALPDSQRFIIEVCSLFKNAFLQQNAFDDTDRFSSIEKQQKMLELILVYWRRGSEAIRRGVTIVKLRRIRALRDIVRVKSTIENEDAEQIDRLTAKLERSIDQLESIYV